MEIKVHVLHCGRVLVDKSLPFQEKSLNPLAFTGLFRSKKNKVWLPVSAYLIEHPKGLVLIDTGWHTDVRGSDMGRKHMGFIHWLINKADLPQGQAIDEQLAARGFKPSDIDYLVMSHLHSDHASGMKLVKDAKKIIVSDIEWEEAKNNTIRYIPSMWEGVKIDTFSYDNTGIGPEGKSFDLFGDGSFVMVSVPGHTMGLGATIIKNKDKFVLLTSDVGYAKKSWEQMIMPGIQVNKTKVKTSLEWVRTTAQDPNCIEAIANHDTDMQPKTIIV